uniref:Uncharacterized protein n=1 Tax=Anguilla anguilla TaxID=7936 RepID=A0A0E9VAF1_ANGAN
MHIPSRVICESSAKTELYKKFGQLCALRTRALFVLFWLSILFIIIYIYFSITRYALAMISMISN